MSMAIVSGPTPPGTGVMAPATSATSGWTSPTSTEPFRSKSARRGCPSVKIALATFGVGHEVDAHVNNRRSRLHERSSHETGPAQRRNQDVGACGNRRQVLRARVADCHRRVPMKQKQRDRLSDDVAAADDDRVLAADFNAGALQQFDNSARRARDEFRAILHEPSDVHGRHAVYVFCRIDRIKHLLHRSGTELDPATAPEPVSRQWWDPR